MNRRSLAVLGTAVLVLAGLLVWWLVLRGATLPRDDHPSAGPSEEYYTCPMHPSVRSDRPGTCPICGMTLVRKTVLADTTGAGRQDLAAVSLSPVQRVLANVSTSVARRANLVREITALGNIVPAEPRRATVSARFGGRVEKMFVDALGMRVRAGEPLFALYSPELISAENEYLLSLDSAEGGRGESALDFQAASRTRLIERFGMTEEQVRALAKARTVSPTVTFHSPLGGTVLEKNVREGEYVTEGFPLYGIADLTTVWALLDVYEDDIRFVGVGESVLLSSAAYPERRFSGTVTFVDPEVSADTRTVRVRVELPNREHLLRPNTYVTGSIRVSLPDRVVIPTDALLRTGRRNIVWQEVGTNRFEPVDVEVGASAAGIIEILSGLREGAVIASSGGFLIDSESQLQKPSQGNAPSKEKEVAGGPAAGAGGGQSVTITVKGGCSPEEIRAKAGKPLVLRLCRGEKSMCSAERVFPTLSLMCDLTAWKTTEVRFTPDRPGEIPFDGGRGMLHGRNIVNR